ncbi:MAG: C4-dicarboxylate ABC transporter substrate-binding protein [Candidatus Rokuibacteriota bacterium]|nr:MAG: C4-dicarboxylate ABC transporter substrate-binding protein [Candidatus Rokubacteria bacterium]
MMRVLAVMLVLVAATAWSAEAATVTFKCATATLNDVQHEWCKRYIARLEKRSNGQIKGQIFPASQLGSIPRMIEGVQFGTIEAWIGPPEFLVGIDPRFQVLSAPYLFEDFDHTHRVINDREFLDRFLAMAESRGLKGVSLIVYGPAGFCSRTPIHTPDDMRGKKFRVLATPIEMAMVSSLGATGIPMTLGEVLAALQQGAIDGSESAITVFTTFKYFDVAKYFVNTNHYFITAMGAVSKKWLDGLPPDLQKIVVEEGRAVHAEMLEWGKDFHRAAVNLWKEKTKDGWIELTPEQRAAFRARMEGVDAKVAPDVAGIKEWLDLLRAKAKALK